MIRVPDLKEEGVAVNGTRVSPKFLGSEDMTIHEVRSIVPGVTYSGVDGVHTCQQPRVVFWSKCKGTKCDIVSFVSL